ncbi:MAG: PDZ domain-containing protein, partial [Elusimicrobiota bacterium]
RPSRKSRPAALKSKPRPAALRASPAGAGSADIPSSEDDSQDASGAQDRSPEEPVRGRAAQAGLMAEPSGLGLWVSQVAPKSLSESLGLRAGDTLLYLNDRKLTSPSDLDGAFSLVRARHSAVVLRAGEVSGLRSASEPLAPASPRSARELSPAQRRAQEELLEEAAKQAPQTLQGLKTPSFRVLGGETLWLRFPKGIPSSIAEGEVFEGETAAPMTMDSKLDFSAIPEGTRVWAQAVSVQEQEGGAVKVVRLHLFKLLLAGGHAYPCSARLLDSGDGQPLLRVSKGGSLVAGPVESSPYLAEPGSFFQIRFLQTLTLHESAGFFKAGPGLWLRSSGGGSRSFEISHIIPKRSADEAGLKAGDRVLSVDGRGADRLSFHEAVSLLYGPSGSSVGLQVLRQGSEKSESLSLRRGMFYRTGLGMSVRREGDSVFIKKVVPESPAAAAGIQEGDLLPLIGDRETGALGEAELRAALKEDLWGENGLTVHTPGKSPRKVSLRRGSFATPLEPALFEDSPAPAP